jgi:hypothetical protein
MNRETPDPCIPSTWDGPDSVVVVSKEVIEVHLRGYISIDISAWN